MRLSKKKRMRDVLLKIENFYATTAGSSHGVSLGNKTERGREAAQP